MNHIVRQTGRGWISELAHSGTGAMINKKSAWPDLFIPVRLWKALPQRGYGKERSWAGSSKTWRMLLWNTSAWSADPVRNEPLSKTQRTHPQIVYDYSIGSRRTAPLRQLVRVFFVCLFLLCCTRVCIQPVSGPETRKEKQKKELL